MKEKASHARHLVQSKMDCLPRPTQSTSERQLDPHKGRQGSLLSSTKMKMNPPCGMGCWWNLDGPELFESWSANFKHTCRGRSTYSQHSVHGMVANVATLRSSLTIRNRCRARVRRVNRLRLFQAESMTASQTPSLENRQAGGSSPAPLLPHNAAYANSSTLVLLGSQTTACSTRIFTSDNIGFDLQKG